MTTLCPPQGSLTRARWPPMAARRMARCECSGAAFSDLARLVENGLSLDQACDRSGCGRTCGACLPDLQAALHETLSKSRQAL